MTPLRNFVIYLYGHGVPLVHLWLGQALVTSLESQSRDPWWIIGALTIPSPMPPREGLDRHSALKLFWSLLQQSHHLTIISGPRIMVLAGRHPQPHLLNYFTHLPPGSSPGLLKFYNNYHSAMSLILLRFSFLPFSAPSSPIAFCPEGWVESIISVPTLI